MSAKCSLNAGKGALKSFSQIKTPFLASGAGGKEEG